MIRNNPIYCKDCGAYLGDATDYMFVYLPSGLICWGCNKQQWTQVTYTTTSSKDTWFQPNKVYREQVYNNLK